MSIPQEYKIIKKCIDLRPRNYNKTVWFGSQDNTNIILYYYDNVKENNYYNIHNIIL